MVTLVWGGGEGVLGEGSPPPLVFNYSKEALRTALHTSACPRTAHRVGTTTDGQQENTSRATHGRQTKVPQDRNEIHQRGPKLEVDFGYTNLFLGL